MRLIISLRRNQPANHNVLQKEPTTGSRNSATQNAKLLLKMPISNVREIRSNTVLPEFGLASFNIRQLPLPKVKFKDNFLNIFDFTIPLFKALPQDG